MLFVDILYVWIVTSFTEMLSSSCWLKQIVTPDIKSVKIFCFGLPFLIVILIALIAYFLAWHPATIWHKCIKGNLGSETSDLVLNDSTVTNSGTVDEIRRIPVNFLPETSEIEVLDDISETSIVPEIFPQKRLTCQENESEALVALRKAIQMKRLQKFEKAQKLFQHALSLCPSHPDILNCYGEFLEEQEKDIIKADHLYRRALTICPQHSRAIVNSKRTLPVVEEIDEKQLSRIDIKRIRLIEIPPNEPSFKRMKKEAYFQHIHHTVAIEGNTMTLAETRVIVETGMAIPGKSILEHNEIIGLESALRFINNSLVNKIGPITVEDILNIHKRVLGNVDPVQAGSFRKTQVYVGEHTPPAASDVYNLMEDFVDWLNSDLVVKMHPVKQAALAHYKLVFIHPFVDGNGRTARLLMNLILMREGYPPVIIRKQDRSLYYKYLQVANEGDVRPFVRFIAQSTEGTLDVYLYATEYGVSEVKALEAQKSDPAEVIEM